MKIALLLTLGSFTALLLSSCDSTPQSYDPHPQQNVKSTADYRPTASNPAPQIQPAPVTQ
jgi:hypothetical protein